MYRKRWLEKKLIKLVKTRPVVYIGGARQTGKTSILKHTFPKIRYISFDSPTERIRALEDPKGFLEAVSTPVILDEIQYVPELMIYIKMNVDNRRKPGMYILTGSQQYTLLKGLSESLAGRVGILNLRPFSTREWMKYNKIGIDKLIEVACKKNKGVPIKEIYKSMLTGGYPEILGNASVDLNNWFASYISTYLERDLRVYLKVGNLRDFERFMRVLAIRAGQLLSYSDLARDIGIAVSTAKEWVSSLCAGYQVLLMEPYYNNLGKRVIKSPKLYFGDTGLLCSLLGIRSVDELSRSPYLGNIFENWILLELMKSDETEINSGNFWYWRTVNNTEVDLIYDNKGRLTPMEIKLSQTFKSNWISGLKSFISNYNKSTNSGIVVNSGEHGKFNSDICFYNVRNWLKK
ncbi:MAG: ATP-binding protein [Elusimicrobia bacterium]|nr:ATP-binding protein [Elusimicrobiota bacterium]